MNYSCLIVKVKRSNRVNRLIEERGLNLPDRFHHFYCVTNKVYSDEEIEEIKNDTNAERQKKLAINRFTHSYVDFKSSAQFNADNKIDATYNILKARNFITVNKKWILVQEKPKSNRHVYAFELTRGVLEEDSFNKANPTYEESKPLLYIGETSKAVLDRYNEHTNINSRLAARFMKKYGVRNFNKANWTPNIYKETKINPENKNDFNSKYYERKIALKLRAKGFGVWFN